MKYRSKAPGGTGIELKDGKREREGWKDYLIVKSYLIRKKFDWNQFQKIREIQTEK